MHVPIISKKTDAYHMLFDLMNSISLRSACYCQTSTASRVWIYSKYQTCFFKYFVCLGASFTQKFIQRGTIIQIFKTIHGIHKISYELTRIHTNANISNKMNSVSSREFWWILVSSMNSYKCNCFDKFQSRCHYRWHLSMVGIYITVSCLIAEIWVKCNFSFHLSSSRTTWNEHQSLILVCKNITKTGISLL